MAQELNLDQMADVMRQQQYGGGSSSQSLAWDEKKMKFVPVNSNDPRAMNSVAQQTFFA